jgi:hypothetical protein
MEHTKRIAVTGVAALMVFGTGAAALAAVPSADGVINGCRSHLLGTIRVIDAETGQQCNARETALNWNQTGPQGPAGRDGNGGAAGPAGPAGAQGQKGDPGVTDAYFAEAAFAPPSVYGVTDVLSLDLPAGAYVIQATTSIGSERSTSGECFLYDFDWFGRTDFFFQSSGIPISVLGARTYKEPTTVQFSCAWGGYEGSIQHSTMVATKVGLVHQKY